jgi:hypothetical protein
MSKIGRHSGLLGMAPAVGGCSRLNVTAAFSVQRHRFDGQQAAPEAAFAPRLAPSYFGASGALAICASRAATAPRKLSGITFA